MRRFTTISSVFLVSFGVASSARAATITVDTTTQGLATDAPDGKCSLGEAIVAANTNAAVDTCTAGSSGADTIVVPAGTYTLAAPWAAGGYANALPDVTETLTVQGADPTTTTLSIDTALAIGFFHSTGGGTSTWQHLTFSGGSGNNRILLQADGTFTDDVFTGHVSGCFVHSAGYGETYDHVTFHDNASCAFDNENATANVTASKFLANKPDVELATNSGTLNVTGSTFDGNSSLLLNVFPTSGSYTHTTLTGSSFTNTTATTSGQPGVVSLTGGGDLTVDGCTFDGNKADGTAALALAGTTGTVKITNSTFHGNSAANISAHGGAIGISCPGSCTGASVTIDDSTFVGNSVTGSGALGGAIGSDGSISVSLNNVTIAGNSSATAGGGIAYYPSASTPTSPLPFALSNTIVAGNSVAAGGVGADARTTGGLGFTSNGYSLIGIGADATFSSASGDQIGTAAAPIDAKLAPYGDYGGATKASPPYVSSPAVGKGSPSASGAGACGAQDQEGVARPAGGCTIGAIQTTQPDPTADAGPDVGVDTGIDGAVADSGTDAGRDTSVADSGKPDTATDALADVSNEAGPPIAEKTNDGGCGCRVAGEGSSRSGASLLVAALVGALVVARRRRTV